MSSLCSISPDPIVNLSISEYSLMEAQGSVTALVSRYGETSAATDVEFTTTGISAAGELDTHVDLGLN